MDEICRQFADQGRLIEAGFVSLRYGVMAPDAGPEQIAEMRMAFFAGAQHLFASLLGILEPGAEATDKDMNRITLISAELDHFVAAVKAERQI